MALYLFIAQEKRIFANKDGEEPTAIQPEQQL